MRVERANDKSPKSNFKSLKEQLFGKPAKTTVASAPVKKIKSDTKVVSKSLKQRKESQVAAVDDVKKTKSPKGSLASKLGALNAAHASAQAFANASPNSRVGLIRAYFIENAQSVEAAKLVDAANEKLDLANQALADAQKLQKIVDDTPALLETLKADLPALQEAATAAAGLPADDPVRVAAEKALKDLTDKILAAETAAADAETKLKSIVIADLEAAAQKAKDEAVQALADAAAAEADALKALEAAANKPVTDEVRDALDKLLEGKIILDETASVEDPGTEAILIGDM
jgi:hypothetical protein